MFLREALNRAIHQPSIAENSRIAQNPPWQEF
jgi:hypothetical protein